MRRQFSLLMGAVTGLVVLGLACAGGQSAGAAAANPAERQRVQYRLRADEGRAWWASNGRDVLNAIALGAVSSGLWVYGFRGPLVVCVAGTLVLLLSMAQMRLESRPGSTWWSVGVALALGAPVLVAPAAVARFFQRVVLVLAP